MAIGSTAYGADRIRQPQEHVKVSVTGLPVVRNTDAIVKAQVEKALDLLVDVLKRPANHPEVKIIIARDS